MEENNFMQQLDELIQLFEELQKRAITEGIVVKDDPMHKNFELLAGNYKMIKSTIPPELIEEIGEPIKEMILQMVEQLKAELGVEDSPVSEVVEDSVASKLEGIDNMLKGGNLSAEEVNSLLDKRSNLKKELP